MSGPILFEAVIDTPGARCKQASVRTTITLRNSGGNQFDPMVNGVIQTDRLVSLTVNGGHSYLRWSWVETNGER